MPAHRRFSLALVPLALLLVAAVTPGTCRLIRGASTPDPADDVSVCRSDVWIHQGSQRIGNPAGAGQGTFPSWNGTQPTGEFGAGAGGATVTHWGPSVTDANHAPTTFISEGTVTGNIDNLAATLYLSAPIGETVYGDLYPHIRLSVDGQVVYEGGDDIGYLLPLSSSGTGVASIRFALTGLYDVIGQENDPAKEHTVRLLIRGWTQGDEAVFLYDAGDVPSGFVFNIEPNKMGAYTKFEVA